MMLRKTAAAVAFIAGTALVFPALAADPAVFDVATGRLRMPILQIDQSLKFRDVVIQLVTPGSIRFNDASVGADISFSSSGNVLRIPQLSFAGALYPAVSLTGPGFTLVSFGEAVVDGGNLGTYTLEVRVTAQGMAVPPITINNVPKPATQAEFCSDPALQQAVIQNAGISQASWSMTACSFNGTSGRMNGLLTITSPITLAIPVTADYTYR
jgi:hypothetical protein